MDSQNSLKEEKKLNIGILGCASVARRHAINALKNIDEVNKIFISSRDVEKAKRWAEEFGIEFKNSYEDLIDDPSIDAVYVPLPTKLHEEWVLKCAQKGKHVICEKTISSDFESVKRIADSFKNKELVLFENFACDYHPQHSKILSLIKEGRIGNLLVFSSYFGFEVLGENIRKDEGLDNGCFNDQGAYIVFMSRKIFQEEPVSVTADFNQNQGTIYMEFPNNRIAMGGFGFNHAYQNNYSIWGSKGLVEIKRAYSIAPTAKAIISLFKANPQGDATEQIEITGVNQFELIFKDFCRTNLDNDEKKRKEKYSSILSQGKVMDALRTSNFLDKKVFINCSE